MYFLQHGIAEWIVECLQIWHDWNTTCSRCQHALLFWGDIASIDCIVSILDSWPKLCDTSNVSSKLVRNNARYNASDLNKKQLMQLLFDLSSNIFHIPSNDTEFWGKKLYFLYGLNSFKTIFSVTNGKRKFTLCVIYWNIISGDKHQ